MANPIQTAGGSSTGPGLSESFASNITAGNAVIVCVSGNTSAATPTPSSGGDVFVKQVEDGTSSSAIWACLSSAGGYKTVNATEGGSGNSMWIYEISLASCTLDKTSSNFGSIGDSTFTSGATATTTRAAEFWVGCGGGITSGSAVTASGPGGSWTNLTAFHPQQGSSGVYCPGVSGWQNASSTGAATYSGSFSGGTSNDGQPTGVVATFYSNALVQNISPATATVAAVAVTPILGMSAAVSPANVGVLVWPFILPGLICSMTASAGTDGKGNAYATGYTGPVSAFYPIVAAPNVVETAHAMPAMAASWAVGVGGLAKYMLDSAGNLNFVFILRTIGTKTDATAIWAAGSLPAPYRPPEAKYWPVVMIGSAFTYAAELPSILFGTDGSIKIYGIASSTVTGIDAHGILPLNL